MMDQQFAGNDRFGVQRVLGRGGMGIVLEAVDRARAERVALKVLLKRDPTWLLRFKNEFRTLADVSHPNLVQLYELVEDAGTWFFTMELLDGVDFLRWVRRDEAASAAQHSNVSAELSTTTAATGTAPTGRSTTTAAVAHVQPLAAPADAGRLRSGLAQLGRGLSALHEQGKLHRDIKPSNVLVTTDERLVILDFGVMASIDGTSNDRSDRSDLTGTLPYMAPEVFAGQSASPASDCYSVGVMLYEALTGEKLFRGGFEQVRSAKLNGEPPAPSELVDVSPDLDRLCVALLAREPHRRPSAVDIAALEGRELAVATPRGTELVGRARQLAALDQAYARTLDGQSHAVFVRGPSGMGKSALIDSWLLSVGEHDQAPIVIRGRCYERESVPYRALDDLVDSMCGLIGGDSDAGARELFAGLDTAALTRAFPVLSQFHNPDGSRETELAPIDLRRRAFSALRTIVARLSERTPLILFIDDLQWGDVGSGPFLSSILSLGDRRILLLASFRSEDEARSPLLSYLLEKDQQGAERFGSATRITVTRLPLPEARELALRLIDGPERSSIAENIARESQGSPYFVHELARFAQRAPERAVDAGIDTVLLERIGMLGASARDVLYHVAVAGLPVPQSVIREACGVDAMTAIMAGLRAEHLVRLFGPRDDDAVECYHDRIRETVLSELPRDQLSRHHGNLADALAIHTPHAHQSLAFHAAGAGRAVAAARHAALAAEAATSELAFDQSARLYEWAIELASPEQNRTELLHRLGDALASAGHGAASGEAYLEAARAAEPNTALRLRTDAAAQLLRSGRVDEGLQVLEPLLGSVGIRLPSSPRAAMFQLLRGRAFLRLRGLGYKAKKAQTVSPETLGRIDLAWAGACGLAMIDPLRGAALHIRHLLHALAVGEPGRIGRALTLEVGYAGVRGRKAHKQLARILAKLGEAARITGEPALRGTHLGCSGLAAFFLGRFADCRTNMIAADRILTNECSGVGWERSTVHLTASWALYYLGSYAELDAWVDRAVRHAEQRGDLYAVASMRTGLASTRGLAVGRPKSTRAEVNQSMADWSQGGFHLQHYWRLLAQVQVDLYEGHADDAHARVAGEWEPLQKSLLMYTQTVRIEALFLRARAALAAGRHCNSARVHIAERCAAKISRERTPWGNALASIVEAGVGYAKRGTSPATGYRRAGKLLAAADMAGFAAATGLFAARLAGEDGESYRARLVDLGVVEPARFAAMLLGVPPPH